MARRRKREADILDLIGPIAGLLMLGVFFVPGFKQLLGTLAIVALVVLVGGLIAFLLWRYFQRRKAQEDAFDGVAQPRPPAPQWQASSQPVSSPVPAKAPTSGAPTNWTLDLLKSLEWKRFEDLIAAYSRELGYEAKTTRIGPDGGVDVLLYESGQTKPLMVIQCKAWNTYKVGIKPVRELFGVMAADGVANGGFFTTSEFTGEALEFAKGRNLDLVDGRELLERFRQIQGDGATRLLALATKGDYTTPTCPRCGVKMVLRTASKGASEGQSFWGCRSYPRCKSTFKLSES